MCHKWYELQILGSSPPSESSSCFSDYQRVAPPKNPAKTVCRFPPQGLSIGWQSPPQSRGWNSSTEKTCQTMIFDSFCHLDRLTKNKKMTTQNMVTMMSKIPPHLTSEGERHWRLLCEALVAKLQLIEPWLDEIKGYKAIPIHSKSPVRFLFVHLLSPNSLHFLLMRKLQAWGLFGQDRKRRTGESTQGWA